MAVLEGSALAGPACLSVGVVEDLEAAKSEEAGRHAQHCGRPLLDLVACVQWISHNHSV